MKTIFKPISLLLVALLMPTSLLSNAYAAQTAPTLATNAISPTINNKTVLAYYYRCYHCHHHYYRPYYHRYYRPYYYHHCYHCYHHRYWHHWHPRYQYYYYYW